PAALAPSAPSEQPQARTLRTESESSSCGTPLRHFSYLKTIPPTSHFQRHNRLNALFITENRQFPKFIIITMILTYPHDSAIHWEEVLRGLWEVPLLDDLRALVEFAHAGSIVGAADRLFRTPSAITRQVQRLEAALGAELLDRSVKPPRLNPL